jgi:oligoribonuclease NrnB/cAMP/cGMP phosphodiesterase (DHH superfamily)
MKRTVILYHADCSDGFSAAWVAWKKFGTRAEYIGIEPGQDANQLAGLTLKDRDIYFIDVSASAAELRKLVAQNRSVIVIDHHVTNAKTVRSATGFVFDTAHCGSMLAWRFFHPRKPVPLFLKYVEDNDLWKYREPYAMEVGAAAMFLEMNFKSWSAWAGKMESTAGRKRIIEHGKHILAYERELVKKIATRAVPVRFLGHRVLAVNSSALRSELGHELAKRCPPLGIVWHEEADGGVHVSLRSEGTVDVSRLAKRFPGGGGHPRAAGFSVRSVKALPWKVIKK